MDKETSKTENEVSGGFPFAQIDISLIEHALSLSYEARVDAHESARNLMEDLRQAGREFYERRSKGIA